MKTDRPGDSRQPDEKGQPPSLIEIDAATLARVVREQQALPVTDDEAERLARAIERSKDDEEFLANAVSAVRLLADQIERSTANAPQRHEP